MARHTTWNLGNNEAPPIINPIGPFNCYGFSITVYDSEENMPPTGNQSNRIFYYTPIVFPELNEKKKKWIWSNKNSVRIYVELQRKEFNDLVRDHLKKHFRTDDETALLWIVIPLKINSLKAFIIKANDGSRVNDIIPFHCNCLHSVSMVFEFKCPNDEVDNIVKNIENKQYAIEVVLACYDPNQNQMSPSTHRIKAFNPGFPNLSLLTTLKEQSELYDLHTHLLGMGNAGFWVDTILMNPNIMPTNSTFCENESVRRNLCPLIWYDEKHDNQNKRFGFVDGDEAVKFFDYLIMNSELPKKTRSAFNTVIKNIQQQFSFSKVSSISKLINDFKLNQDLLRRKLCFKDDFSYDVVLKLDDLWKGLGIKKMDNHDLKQVEVAEVLSVYSSQPAVKFRDWIIFNAREQKFEIVYGIRVEDLRQLIHIDPNAPNEARRLARAHIINAFSMCDAEGTPARHVDLQSFHGNFTPQFYPHRFALKDSIYHQRLDVLAALIAHIVERYESCLPPIKYCEFSISVNDLTRAWMFDVLRSFPVDEDVILSTTQDHIVLAEKKFSSFSQIVCKNHFSYLRVAYKPYKTEKNKFHCKYKVNYKFLAGFSREKVKSKHFKTQDDALRLLTDYPQVAISQMKYEMMNSLELKTKQLATRETFSPFVDQLMKLKKDIKKKPFFYKWLVGLDLFADELGYPYCPFVARPFIKYVQQRRVKYNKRFGLRIHGGENVIYTDNDSAAYRLFIAHMYIVFISLRFLQRELNYGIRIGHGIAFERILARSMNRSRHRKSSVLLAIMENEAPSLFKNIAFEVNITSNEYLLGHTLRQADFAHALRLNALFDAKIPVILSTDDDGIWPIDQCSFVHPGHQSLAAEYCRAISSRLIWEDRHLEDILQSAKEFNFWDPQLDINGCLPDDDDDDATPDDDDDDDAPDNDDDDPAPDNDDDDATAAAAAIVTVPDDDNDDNDDEDATAAVAATVMATTAAVDEDDDNIVNPIIVHPNIINCIYERYITKKMPETDLKKLWQQLSTGRSEDLKWQNEAMQHVAFICVCASSKEDDANRDLIREEYEKLFDRDYFTFIYKNWKKIRNEFMSLDDCNNFQTLSHRVFIEKSSLRSSTNNRNVKVKIHAFGPNMINNENVEELECFKKYYPKYIENVSLVIYTNNDKNTYHYHKTSESLQIEVNPNPSKRDTQRENFLYALCEHASAATAALHRISDHVSRYMTSADRNTNGDDDDDDNVLDVFDSDTTSQTLFHYGFRNKSTVNSKLKGLLHDILNDLPKRQKSDLSRPTEKKLIKALHDHRLAFRTLNLALKYVEEKAARDLNNAPQDTTILTTLCVILNKIGQEGTAHLTNILTATKLTELNLSKLIKDEGTKHLADALKDNRTLETLHLGWDQIEDQEAKDLAAILHTTKIIELDLKHNEIGDKGAQYLADALKKNNTMLLKLDLSGNQIGDEGARYLAEALEENQKLTLLNLSRNDIGDEGAKQLANALEYNETLTQLHLYKNRIRDKGISHLADALQKNKTLIELHVGWNLIRNEGAKCLADALKKNTILTKLDIGGNQIRDEGAKYLIDVLPNRETKFKEFGFGHNLIEENVEKELRDASKDTKASYCQKDQGTGSETTSAFNASEKKKAIELIENVREKFKTQCKEDLINFFKTSTLTVLDFTGRIGDLEIRLFAKALRENKSLQTLHLSWNQIKDHEVKDLADVLNSMNIVELYLRHNEIEDEGARCFANALKENTILTTLDLSGNQIGDEGAGHLAKALKENQKLTLLNLSRNDIGDEGAKQLANALEKNETLTQLHLYKNRIRDKGISHLADALQKNKKLIELHVGWNVIRDEGAKCLADALKKNTILTKLDIGGNQIGNEGAGYLANALKDNEELTVLDVDGNEIGDKGVNDLIKKINGENLTPYETQTNEETSNTTLKELYLGGNQIGDKGVQHFGHVLQKNKGHINFHRLGNQIGEEAEEKLTTALRNLT